MSFDPNYLKQTFFPEMLEELTSQKFTKIQEHLLRAISELTPDEDERACGTTYSR